MAYLFPYAGSERQRKSVKSEMPPARREIDATPVAPLPAAVSRPIELPVMAESLRKILLEVCKHHNVHPNDVAGPSRAAKFVNARRHYVVRARTETEHSFPRIGRAIRKDHTSAVYLYEQWCKEGDKTIAVWRPPVRVVKPGPKRKINPFELSPSEKAVIAMVEQGMSFEEIAEKRNIRLKSARGAYMDGRRKLRRMEMESELV